MGRPKKFNHELARKMYETGGYTKAELGRYFGVAPQSIDSALDPEKAKEKAKRFFAATCHYCGKPCTWNPYQAGQKRKGMDWRYTTVPRCRECAAIDYSMKSEHPPTDDELWCPGCKQYKPDDDFQKSAKRFARRGRRNRCKACDAADRRIHRHKTAPPCRNCGKQTKDRGSIWCLDCYRAMQRRAA